MSNAPEADIVQMVDRPDSGPSEAGFHKNASDPVEYFGRQENPFTDSVNPDYFFRTAAHEEAYLRMKQCIEDDISLGLITARSGTGKTLLTQILLQELDSDKYRPALVLAYPRISRSALLRELADELDISDLPAQASLHRLINTVQEKIFELHSEGRKPVIIIDEVHFLGGDTLHLLRTLSNIETSRKKLVTILLFGEEGILKKLDKPKYRAILSRLFVRVQLRPLNTGEVEQYVKFRSLMAGGKPNLFEKDSFAAIHKLSEGVPREINRICHNALRESAGAGGESVTRKTLERLK